MADDLAHDPLGSSEVDEDESLLVATVDRALTGRLPVRRDTAERIASAATELGFHAAGLIAKRTAEEAPRRKVGFLLQQPKDTFYSGFADALQRAIVETRLFRGASTIDYWSAPQDPDEIAGRLRRLARRADAVAMVSPDHPVVTEAVEEVMRGGTPVFSLLSDFAFASRSGYVGVDNKKAGRTAAWVIANCARHAGKVVVFVGSHRFHGHELREIGFRAFFREHAPDFTLIETPATLESSALAHEAARELLAAHDDLVGCYVAGGGMDGVIAALHETGRKPRPILVCSALTSTSRRAVLDGTVKALVTEPIDRIALDLTERIATILERPSSPKPDLASVALELITSENL